MTSSNPPGSTSSPDDGRSPGDHHARQYHRPHRTPAKAEGGQGLHRLKETIRPREKQVAFPGGTQDMFDGADGARLLTVKELAAVLNVSVAWVRKGILERSIPYTKIGRNVRFTPEQVVQIVKFGERPQLHHLGIGTRDRGSARTKL